MVVAVLVGALLACGGDDGGSAGGDIEGLEIERIGPYEHIRVGRVDYDRPAPSGGDHLFGATWLTCGVYDGEVPDEYAVHSLEHGAVWIALGPDSTEADREQAVELAEGEKVVVSDVPDLPNPVELVAWGARLPLDSLDDPRAERFIDEFVNASISPEAGSACEGAVGNPPTPPDPPPG